MFFNAGTMSKHVSHILNRLTPSPRIARLCARLHVPVQHRAVLGRGEERLVVAGERDGRDGQLVPAEEAGGYGGGAAGGEGVGELVLVL